jgi:hypothetical protein
VLQIVKNLIITFTIYLGYNSSLYQRLFSVSLSFCFLNCQRDQHNLSCYKLLSCITYLGVFDKNLNCAKNTYLYWIVICWSNKWGNSNLNIWQCVNDVVKIIELVSVEKWKCFWFWQKYVTVTKKCSRTASFQVWNFFWEEKKKKKSSNKSLSSLSSSHFQSDSVAIITFRCQKNRQTDRQTDRQTFQQENNKIIKKFF